MAITAPKPPEQPGTRDILEAIQELRRHFDDRMDRFDERLRKVETDVARVDGRLGELSARVPTIWTVATLVFAIFGAAFVLLRFGLSHGVP